MNACSSLSAKRDKWNFPYKFYLCLLILISDRPAIAWNSSTFVRGASCRTERRIQLPYEQYRRDTCARCYHYLPSSAFVYKFRYHPRLGILQNPETGEAFDPDPVNISLSVLESFATEDFVLKWQDCCLEAWACCEQMLDDPLAEGGELFCPRTWDGWQCWPDTPAGTVARAPCMGHIYFNSDPPACPRFAVKECLPNGTWYLNDQSNEWTNYSSCGRMDEHRRFLYFHMAMYAISIVFLVPALVIFSLYKQLQVHRITMHKNLFASLLLNGLVVILFKAIVIIDEMNSSENYKTIMEQNGPWCKFLFILTKYFRMTNYMWMFCEGFYLHKLIAAAFAEQKNLIMFYVIGWVFPVLPVGTYAILRKTLADDKCWAFPIEIYEWIMNTPNVISLLVNLAFLCNIIRVLVTKLRATNANEPSQYRKAVRATLVLVPLFGLHFCLVIYRPPSGECGVTEFYTYFNYAMDGLQGFLVSLTFCYLNGEVLYLLRRSYQRYNLHREVKKKGQSISMMTRMSATQDSMVTDTPFRCRTPPVRNGHSSPTEVQTPKEVANEDST